MKKAKILCMAIMITIFTLGTPVTGVFAAPKDEGDVISVVFSTDINDHLDAVYDKADDKKGTGGMAKIKTVIDDVKDDYPNTFVLDSGNNSSGSLYDTIFSKEAPSLRMLGVVGYDATTLGKSEFSYGAEELASMMTAARAKSYYSERTELVSADINWDKTDDKDVGAQLKNAFYGYGGKEYTVVQKGTYGNTYSMAVFGVMGKDAKKTASDKGITVNDGTKSAKAIVKEIKDNEDVDMIVCLTQGRDGDADKKLGKEVKDIDLIVSGGSDQALKKPVKAGNAFIVSAGNNTDYEGHITLKKKDGGNYKVDGYKLISLDKDVDESETVAGNLQNIKSRINEDYFNKYGYDYDEEIAKNEVKFPDIEEFKKTAEENNYGDFVSDAYKYAGKEGEESDPQVAVFQASTAKNTLGTGTIDAEELYGLFPSVSGADGLPGDSLITIYLTGKELKNLAELSSSAKAGSDQILHMSGLVYSYDPQGKNMNKVTKCRIETEDGTKKIESGKLYKVVTGEKTAKSISKLAADASGDIKISPKSSKGDKVKDFDGRTVKVNGREVKTWSALALYMNSFEKGDGGDISKVPDKYDNTDGRKSMAEGSAETKDSKKSGSSFSFSGFFKDIKNAGWIKYGVIGLVILVVLLVLAAVVPIIRRKRRQKEPAIFSTRQKKKIFKRNKRKKNIFSNKKRW